MISHFFLILNVLLCHPHIRNFQLLKGSSKKKNILSYCLKKMKDLIFLLNDMGFSFDKPVGWLPHPKTGEVLQMDALFIKC